MAASNSPKPYVYMYIVYMYMYIYIYIYPICFRSQCTHDEVQALKKEKGKHTFFDPRG